MKNEQADTEVRQLKDHNIKYFKSELSKVDWEIKCSGDDVNKVYGNFIYEFNCLYNKCCPTSTRKISNQRSEIKSPWLSYGLLKCIRRKNRLHRKFICKPTKAKKEIYKKYRNKLNTTLRLAKQIYFSNLLGKEKNNMRNTWKVLNSIIRPNSHTNVRNNLSLKMKFIHVLMR